MSRRSRNILRHIDSELRDPDYVGALQEKIAAAYRQAGHDVPDMGKSKLHEDGFDHVWGGKTAKALRDLKSLPGQPPDIVEKIRKTAREQAALARHPIAPVPSPPHPGPVDATLPPPDAQDKQVGKPLPDGGVLYAPQNGPSKGTVILDPGHGGVMKQVGARKFFDTGAIGTYGNREVTEVQLNWDLATDIRKQLTARGYSVVMTKNAPFAPYEQARDAQGTAAPMAARRTSFQGDIFVSLHQDSREFNGKLGRRGIQVNYASDGRPVDKGFATKLAGFIGGKPMANDRDIAVLEAAHHPGTPSAYRPAVLIEATNIKDPVDVAHVADPHARQELAASIATGLIKTMDDPNMRLAMSKTQPPPALARRNAFRHDT